jgi:DNA-directed RNA polymerase sigma subunit (sigma70/sigma32)
MLVDAYRAYQDAQHHAEQCRQRFLLILSETREEGHTYTEIGTELGLTRQRVHAILKTASAADTQEETL